MAVRAKFVVTSKSEPKEATRFLGEGQSEQVLAQNISLMAVSRSVDNEENNAFYVNTPSGQINLNVVNQNAAAALELGKEYYVDFTEVV